MLILFSNKSGTAYTAVTAFSEQQYHILDECTTYCEINYGITSDYIEAAWSVIEYGLFGETTLTCYSEQSYHIIYDIIISSEINYSIFNDVSVFSVNSYNIIRDVVNTRFSSLRYHTLSEIHRCTDIEYTIVDTTVNTAFSEIRYDISYFSSISLSFELLNFIEVEYHSIYNILEYDTIEVEHSSIYAFASSGLLGISDRLLGCWNTWERNTSSRDIHLHLYNTFSSNRYSDFTRYYVIYSNKKVHVERLILFSDRDVSFDFYNLEVSNRTAITSSIITYDSIRHNETSAYETNISDVTCVCTQLYSGINERWCVVRGINSSFRLISICTQQDSERFISVFFRSEYIFADQRTCLAQVVLNRFESIRLMGLEVCALSYDISINPMYTQYDINISDSEIILFGETQVINSNTEFNIVPLTYDRDSNDLVLINKNNLVDLVYTGKESLTRILFDRIQNTDSFIYEGYFVILKETAFMKVSFSAKDIDIYDNVDEYIEYIQSKGYLKVEIAGNEMFMNSVTIADVPAFTKVPIKIQVHKDVLYRGNVNILLKWAYPYNDAVVNKILLIGDFLE